MPKLLSTYCASLNCKRDPDDANNIPILAIKAPSNKTLVLEKSNRCIQLRAHSEKSLIDQGFIIVSQRRHLGRPSDASAGLGWRVDAVPRNELRGSISESLIKRSERFEKLR